MKTHLVLLLWLLPIVPALSQTAAPDLIYPKSGSVFLAGPVNFEWDETPSAIIYHLQVSADDSFATTVFDDASIVNPFYAATGLPIDTQLYWRVRAFDGVDSTNWSAVHSLYLLDPHTLGDMQLWVRGDSGVTLSNPGVPPYYVSRWQDYSNNNVTINQLGGQTMQPQYTTEPMLNNAPVIYFDGSDYFMGGQALDLHTNDQTILVIFNDFVSGTNSSAQNRIIQKRGHTTNTDGWCLAPRGDIWNSSVIEKGPASANITTFQSQFAQSPPYSVGDGKYRIISTVWRNALQDWRLYTNGLLHIIATNAGDLRGQDITNPAKPLTIGCSYNPIGSPQTNFFFNGNIAEIMVYHTALDSATRRLAEDYLRFKYAPPVNLGRNITTNASCDPTLLDAGDHFVSYTWSTGETTSSIQVHPGTYSVTVTDIFGVSSSDTVKVTGADSCCQALFAYTNQQHTYTFIDHSTGAGLSYAWDFGDGNTSTSQAAVHTFAGSGIYTVCLVVSNTAGCSDTTCSTFTVLSIPSSDGCCQSETIMVTNTTLPSDSARVIWPTAFTPNGDGSNDTWRVFASSHQSISVTVSRNGVIAFQTNNENVAWAGTCGGALIDGRFDVTIVLTSPSGGILEQTGLVCVWRACQDSIDWLQCSFEYNYDGWDFNPSIWNGESIQLCDNWLCLGMDSTACADTSLNYLGCGDLVWPGDANADGVANNQDILAVGIGYGISGFTRPNATTNWVGQSSPDWLLQLAGGANLKHVDCDGNALIDSNDVAVISLNYGMTHTKGGSPEDRAIGDLYLEFPLDSFVTGDSVVGSLHLGSVSAPVSNVYGIAFSLTYDQNLIDTNSFRLAFVNSWMAPDNNRISIAKDFYLASKIDAGVSRIDHNNASGAGKIADVSFVIQDNIDGKDFITLPLVIQFENVLTIDKDETGVPITASGDTLYITGEVTGIFGPGEKGEVRPAPS